MFEQTQVADTLSWDQRALFLPIALKGGHLSDAGLVEVTTPLADQYNLLVSLAEHLAWFL